MSKSFKIAVFIVGNPDENTDFTPGQISDVLAGWREFHAEVVDDHYDVFSSVSITHTKRNVFKIAYTLYPDADWNGPEIERLLSDYGSHYDTMCGIIQ